MRKGRPMVWHLLGRMDRPVHRDAPVSARTPYDGNEESSSGLSYLSLVDGTLDETECLEEAPHRTTYGP